MNDILENPSKLNGRIFGTAFITSFLSFGIGFSLIEPLTQLSQLASESGVTKHNQLIGFILMAIIHTIANLALISAMLPITAKAYQFARYFYASMALSATIILALASLMIYLIPLDVSNDTTSISQMLKHAYFNGYQLSMCLWGIGGITLIYILDQLKLIPKWMSFWGIVGYVIFIAGTWLELFGYAYGLYANILGGLFEIYLSIYAIKTGFIQQRH